MPIAFFLVGAVAGVVSGISGASGPILLPMLMWAGMSARESIVTVLMLHMLPMSLPALYLFYERGAHTFRLRDTAAAAVGMLGGVFLGALFITQHNVSEVLITRLVSCVMVAMGLAMGWQTL